MTIHTDPNASHAVYAPSSAHRWTVCTASAEAISKLPEQEEGEEAAEGTAAHEEIERCMQGAWSPVDPEHPAAYGVALVLDYVRQLPPGRLWIEQRVALTDQIWGRCDVAHWDDSDQVLTIVDYKNGQRAVDVEENEQLRIYAAASMFSHKLPVKWIRYVVIQPNDWRPYVPRVKQWHEPVADLYAWAEVVAAIPRGSKKFVAGDQCRDCPLFGKCEASLDMLTNVGALVSGLVQPDKIRPEQVAGLLAMQKPIEDCYKKFKKYWESQALKTGVAPAEMKLVTATKYRVWLDESVARKAIFEKFGIEKLSPPTPAQAEDMGLDISDLADRPQGGPALAFANDKRKSWAPKSAAEMFKGVAGVARG